MTFDPSKFENDTAFDPAEFITPSSDSKGHSVAFHFRAAGSTDRGIKQVVASRRFPYITTSDLIRHAIMRHLDWLTQIADLPQVRSTIAMMKLEHDHIRREIEEQAMEEHFKLVQQNIQNLTTKAGGMNEARRAVSRALSIVRQMPEGFYRDRHLVRLESEFSHIMEDKPKPGSRSDDESGEDDNTPARRRQ